MKMNKWLTGFVSALVLAFSAQAAAPAPPDEVVKQVVNHVQDLLQKNHDQYKADNKLFYKVVDDNVVPIFDVPYIAQLVLARNWRGASADQRMRFQTAFKDMLIRSYANALLEYYSSVQVDWQPLRMAPGATDASVNSRLLRDGKQPVAIGFSMHLVSGSWKIYDISIENISLISNFRAQFNSEIKKTGLDDVIRRMESGEYSTKAKTGSSAGAAKSN
ncbi:MAG: MlaC/ttg2D family ABC transporter substrate-binding protein [Stenotrophobium sp.]